MSQHWKADNRAGGISISILGMHVEIEYFLIIFKNTKKNKLKIHLEKFRFDPFSCEEWKENSSWVSGDTAKNIEYWTHLDGIKCQKALGKKKDVVYNIFLGWIAVFRKSDSTSLNSEGWLHSCNKNYFNTVPE